MSDKTTKNGQSAAKPQLRKVQRLSLGTDKSNRSTAQAIGVGENPLNGNGALCVFAQMKI